MYNNFFYGKAGGFFLEMGGADGVCRASHVAPALAARLLCCGVSRLIRLVMVAPGQLPAASLPPQPPTCSAQPARLH